jgi:hypothetical protein
MVSSQEASGIKYTWMSVNAVLWYVFTITQGTSQKFLDWGKTTILGLT